MADCRVTDHPHTTLVTYALGSCIALIVHDPIAQVGGLLHFMLPQPTDPVKARVNPFMFATTGIPLLFQRAIDLGARRQRMVVHAAGGAQMMDQQGVFSIGRRNCQAMREILANAGISLESESTGGARFRTVRLEVGSGRVWLRGGNMEDAEFTDFQTKGFDQWRLMS
jgi:chemotaxis protein CheD